MQQMLGIHPEAHCNRKTRCRRCGRKDHQESSPDCHKVNRPDCGCPDRCTNCLGLHAADDPACAARPAVKNGVIQRLSKARRQEIRKAQANAFRAKTSGSACRGKYMATDNTRADIARSEVEDMDTDATPNSQPPTQSQPKASPSGSRTNPFQLLNEETN